MAYRKTAGLTALAALAAALPAGGAEERGDMFIRGTVTAAPELAAAVAEADRLVVKIWNPGRDGIENDPKYKYIREFSLPTPFAISPPIDMNGAARWPVWLVEISTDRDGDVLSAAEDELFAATPEPLPLGSAGVRLELKPRDPPP